MIEHHRYVCRVVGFSVRPASQIAAYSWNGCFDCAGASGFHLLSMIRPSVSVRKVSASVLLKNVVGALCRLPSGAM
jgi:hypothetical protein